MPDSGFFLDGMVAEGAPTQKVGGQPIVLANFPRKLHENEKKWTIRGYASLDPPMIMHTKRKSIITHKSLRFWTNKLQDCIASGSVLHCHSSPWWQMSLDPAVQSCLLFWSRQDRKTDRENKLYKAEC